MGNMMKKCKWNTKIRKLESESLRKILGMVCICVYAYIVLLPIIRLGSATVNDELRYSLERKAGFVPFLKSLAQNELKMGRPLRIMASFNEACNFITGNSQVDKLIQSIILVGTIVAFGKLITELIGNKRTSYVTMIFILVFLPVTVEHSAPEAFMSLACIPLMELCISLIYWCQYLKKGKSSYLGITVVFWILSLLGYEYMVTYTPVYVLLYFAKGKNKNIVDCVKKCFLPGIIGCFYLFGIFLFQKISGPSYSGSSIGFVSLKSSWNIIKVLVVSALPAAFFVNGKYQYLMYMFTGEKYKNLPGNMLNFGAIAQNDDAKAQLLEFVRKYLLTRRNICILCITIILLLVVFNKLKNENVKIQWYEYIYTLICIGIYIFIPLLPNSVSALYQGAVSFDFFTSLPVSLAIFFTECFFISYVVCLIGNGRLKGIVSIALVIIISPLICFVQGENDIISKEHQKDFARLRQVEELFETNCFQDINNCSIYSPDIFETRNLLAIHETYWNDYANKLGLTLDIKKDKDKNIDFDLYYVDDDYFTIIGKKEIVVLTKRKNDAIKIKLGDNKYIVLNAGEYYYDNDFLCYRFDKNHYTPINSGGRAFDDELLNAGNSLNDAKILEGYYEDGWISPVAKLGLNSGNSGKISLDGYYPFEINNEKLTVDIFVDGVCVKKKIIDSNFFSIDFGTEPKQNVIIEIKSNFVHESGLDKRKLSFILNSLESE